MITEKATIENQTEWNEDKTHRYSLSRIWDKSKPIPLVISKCAGSDDGISSTLTLQLITNYTYSLGYGGFILCNLFSSLDNSTTFDKTTDEVILKYVKAADIKDVIICWGSLKTAKEGIRARPTIILDTLSKLKSKNLLCFTDGKNIQLHPLTPSVRANCELVPFLIEEKSTTKTDTKTQ